VFPTGFHDFSGEGLRKWRVTSGAQIPQPGPQAPEARHLAKKYIRNRIAGRRAAPPVLRILYIFEPQRVRAGLNCSGPTALRNKSRAYSPTNPRTQRLRAGLNCGGPTALRNKSRVYSPINPSAYALG
jgi:hypothetical protein